MINIKKYYRKRRHVHYMTQIICDLHNEIFTASMTGEYCYNKNRTVIHGNLENKAKLLKKYNRRLKLITY